MFTNDEIAYGIRTEAPRSPDPLQQYNTEY